MDTLLTIISINSGRSLFLLRKDVLRRDITGLPFKVKPFSICSLQKVNRPRAAILDLLTTLISDVSTLKAPNDHASGRVSAFNRKQLQKVS